MTDGDQDRPTEPPPPAAARPGDRRQLARRLVCAPAEDRLAELGGWLTSDFVSESPSRPAMRGVAEYRDYMLRHRRAFPDFAVEVTEVLAEGDRVMVRWKATGTHQGDFFGIPATGAPVEFTGISLFTFSGDRIARQWVQSDAMTLFRQLGAIELPTHSVR